MKCSLYPNSKLVLAVFWVVSFFGLSFSLLVGMSVFPFCFSYFVCISHFVLAPLRVSEFGVIYCNLLAGAVGLWRLPTPGVEGYLVTDCDKQLNNWSK